MGLFLISLLVDKEPFNHALTPPFFPADFRFNFRSCTCLRQNHFRALCRWRRWLYLVQDQHVHANSPADGPAVPKFTINHGTGFTGFGAVGWGFGNGLRVEAEGLYNFSHDNYTSSQYETGYTNNEKIKTGYNPFYTKMDNTTQVPCTSSSQKIHGYDGPLSLIILPQSIPIRPPNIYGPNGTRSTPPRIRCPPIYVG